MFALFRPARPRLPDWSMRRMLCQSGETSALKPEFCWLPGSEFCYNKREQRREKLSAALMQRRQNALRDDESQERNDRLVH
jgi:hypothetical protein